MYEFYQTFLPTQKVYGMNELNPYTQDLRHFTHFDIIGDVHGCSVEYYEMLRTLGYSIGDWDNPRRITHPEYRIPIMVGDYVDRGPYSGEVLHSVMLNIFEELMYGVLGNHDKKLLSYWLGNNPQQSKEFQETLESISLQEQLYNFSFKRNYLGLLNELPYLILLDGGKVKVVHGGWSKRLESPDVKKKDAQYVALYGIPTGGMDEQGFPVRSNWQKNYNEEALIVHGHTPSHEIVIENKVWNIDTGCVFGGYLTALRYPEMEVVQIEAFKEYSDWQHRGESV